MLFYNNPIFYPGYTHPHERLSFLTSHTLRGSIWSIKKQHPHAQKISFEIFKHIAVEIDSATFSSLMGVLQEVSKCFVQ